ncbi:MAG: hypothetical protein R2726_17185 [Acidimicrobiales bacterium]
MAVTGAVAGVAMLNAAPPSTASVSDVIVTGSKLVFFTVTGKLTDPPGSATDAGSAVLVTTIVGGTSVIVTWASSCRSERRCPPSPDRPPRQCCRHV